VLLGDGTGGFAAHHDFAVGGRPASVAGGDFNGDGAMDVVATSLATNKVCVLLGDGTGGFAAHHDFAVAKGPDSVAVGKLNGDSRPDLVTANYATSSVSVLLNATGRH
jgi:hypothetical protein